MSNEALRGDPHLVRDVNRDLSDLDELPPRKNIRRLRDIRPLELAISVENKLIERRQKLERWLETTGSSSSGTPLSAYATKVASLVRYALNDGSVVSDIDPAEAADLATVILSDLLSCPAAGDVSSVEAFERIDPYMSDLVVVCCAALGRYRLEVERRPVPDGWLAAMASITPVSVRSYVSAHREWPVPLVRPIGDERHVTIVSARKFLAHRAQQRMR